MKITPKTKKLLIMNIPYFIIFFAFWRIHSSYPIMPYNSVLVALVGSAVIKLAVYINGKDAKKYRKNVEYGSARWGNAEDIAPYVDPKPENNVILTQTESLTMNSRPPNPKYARNKNILIIGGSGSGKTRFFLKPNLMQLHSSYVITDPKGVRPDRV